MYYKRMPEMTCAITVRLTKNQRAMLEHIAKIEDRTIASVVRRMIVKGIITTNKRKSDTSG
jgi:uncharacterized protein (DUF1778 family)